jgi:beta-glucosidase
MELVAQMKTLHPLIVLVATLGLPIDARTAMPEYADPAAAIEERIDNLIASMTLDEKIQALGTDPSVPRLGLRLSGHIEGLHGVALGGPADWGQFRKPDGTTANVPVATTQFPQAVGLAETWDVDVLRRVAEIESIEARYAFQSDKYRRGGLVIRAPNADLARDPRWGRTEESFGEDPFLTGTLATAFVRGLQGDDPKYWRAAALLKHFMANSNEDGRDSSSSNFDERLMREYYSAPFRMAVVNAGARAYMAAYNAWNGIPMAVNPILQSMTVAEWGENGIICTDGGAMTQLVTKHRAFPSLDEAAAAAVHAGINQFLDRHQQPIRDALQHHLMSEADVDGALRGVYRVMIRLGLLDPPGLVPYSAIAGDAEPWRSEEHRAAARWATRKSIVLLKNSRAMLPLDRGHLESVAVIGPSADQVLLDWYSGSPPYTVSPLEGIRHALDARVDVKFAANNDDGAAVRLARNADVAIVVVGNHPTCNAGWNVCPNRSDGKESVDRKSLDLEQESLIKKVLAANRRTIVVLISSFPFTINWTETHVPAILLMTHNSQETGNALADVLFGDFNPAGRLVHTWPRSIDQLPPMMDYDIRHGRTYLYFKSTPLYPFGFGLSYTRFHYSRMRTDAAVLTSNGSIDVSVDLVNVGNRNGDEVVQLYVQLPESKVSRPERSLKAFQRVALRAGETRTLHLRLAARDLAYWDDAAHRFVVEAGRVRLLVGASSSDIRLHKTVQVSGDLALEPDLRQSRDRLNVTAVPDELRGRQCIENYRLSLFG